MISLYNSFGILNLFNIHHPNGVYELKLDIYEEKIVFMVLLELSRKEGIRNIHNSLLNGKPVDAQSSFFKNTPKKGEFLFYLIN